MKSAARPTAPIAKLTGSIVKSRRGRTEGRSRALPKDSPLRKVKKQGGRKFEVHVESFSALSPKAA